MDKHFVQLHLHSEFSLLDGAIKLKPLIEFAKKDKNKAVGISDHGNIFGAVKFFKLAKKENIKPILGCEMYFIPDAKIKDAKEKYFHIIVIVKSKVGYKNLCQLMELSYKEGFYFKPRIDYNMLKKHNEGLIISSGCLGSHIPSLIKNNKIDQAKERIEWFLDIFGTERFYTEVQPHNTEEQIKVNNTILELSKDYGIKTIAACDAHFINKEDRYAHEVLLSIQTKKQMSDPDRMTFGEYDCHLRTTQEMLDFFPNNPEVVWNTGLLADSCEFDFEFGKLFFPKSPIPKNYTEEDYFKKLCFDGLEHLKNENLIDEEKYPEYIKRLELEMSTIIQMGYIGYFLVVSDFIRWSKEQNIPVGPGRGSAAGSLVAWVLKITNVDPIKYNLLFERFLNPERVSMPDIDIDFCIERREEVIDYVRNKYGQDCVCQIITFGTMMAKGVIKDVARTLGFPFQDANALTDLIPNQLKIKLNEAIEQEPKLKEMIDNNPRVKELFDICFKLEGLTRHASKHAAGVVISPKPLREMLPLYVPAKSTELVTQYAMTELEQVGFLKMDFLGLKNLTVIKKTLDAIKKRHNIKINLDKIPFDDPKAFNLLRAGNTNGIFQFESEGIKEVMRKLQPEKFEDLIAVNALYRPGPLGSGMVDDFIDRKHGRKKTTYMFPELEPILNETYGVIVYQEQVMKIASTIAGFSLGGADILRRAMGKKKFEVMKEQKKLFINGAKEKGFDEKKSAELFDLMAYFAGYGFNKSHSTAYALIAYQTAYLKANYPVEFMAALISHETNDPDKLTFYLQEIHDMDIKTMSPDINKSEIEFCAFEDGILFGLKGIKNAGLAALEKIIEERNKKPFLDILDFCKRVDLRTANKRVIESLIYSGALDCFPGNRAQKIAELDKILKIAIAAKKEAETGQMSMFGIKKTNELDKTNQYYAFAPLKDWSDKEKLEKEKEIAGFYLSSHPLKNYPSLKWIESINFKDALDMVEGKNLKREPRIISYGLMQNHKVIKTKKGDDMAFAQFEDFSSNGELIIFPNTYKKVGDLLNEYNIFIIDGFIDSTSSNKCKIKVNNLIPIEQIFEQKKIKSLNFILPENTNEEILNQLTKEIELANSIENKIPLKLKFKEADRNFILEYKNKVGYNLESLKKIEKLGIKIKLVI
ncbi:DNA polymerase III subunit alpha [Candidatus Dependentiae bacterium]|nr:DNA polymerase III subunit alpha [Candidatus Dependentiae bacterium]